MTLCFLCTRRTLSLGAQDATTGHYAKTYTESSGYCATHGVVDSDYDKIFIVPKGFNLSQFGIGTYAKYTTTGVICAPLSEGDEIIANSKYYEVATVEDVDLADSHEWYVCELHEVQMHWDMPAYGTGASVDDARKRTRIWLDTYLLAANLLENDGVTAATYITCWDGATYPIKKVFDTKGVDLIFSCGKGTSEPVIGADHYPCLYSEKPTVTISAIDKTGVSGDNLMWQGEHELRRIGETYPFGSLRNIDTSRPKTQILGSATLHSVECTLNYRRDLT